VKILYPLLAVLLAALVGSVFGVIAAHVWVVS
jgi:hypothetical protein